MASTVYFLSARGRLPQDSRIKRIKELCTKGGCSKVVQKGDLTAIKVHFGERGNDAFMSPVLIRQIVDAVKEAGGNPFLTDTGTLYSGSRYNAVDHITTALCHGFNYTVIGAPVIIADGLRGNHIRDVSVGLQHFDAVHIAGDIYDAQSMVVVSHFKGHEMAGFGGAIKNCAMGCAPMKGKREQHQSGFFVLEKKCIACKQCIEICPEGAIALQAGKAKISRAQCIGCGECMTICPERAIDIDWRTAIPPFIERMVEYAYGVVNQKKGKILFINILLDIVPDCDCVPWTDVPIVPDIGILASTDPVALDKASYDLVNKQEGNQQSHLKKNFKSGQDKFKGIWEHTDSELQITYAEKIGLGTAEYTLVTI